MSALKVVTTFPQNAGYSKAFLETFHQFWPVSALVYYEGHTPPPFESGKVEFRSLDALENRRKFLAIDREPPQRSFLFDAKRFCHKVFAQLDALKDTEKLIWLDADVVTYKSVPLGLLEDLLEDVALVHLGRSSYSETGFVGFNQSHPDFPAFLEKYRALYEQATLYQLAYWTDCHAFDYARWGTASKDLTPDGHGFDHVWNRSVLAEYCTHLKGPIRKREFYRDPKPFMERAKSEQVRATI